MGLNREDAYNLAKQISKYYQVPSSEKVLIQDPPIKKIIKEKRIVEKSDEETSGQRRLPMFVLWIILVVGWIIGIILMVSEIIAGGLVVGITASIVFAILLAINKKPVEEVEEYYDKEVEVTPEPRYEEKIVPNTKRIRALGRISLDFLAIPAHNGTILLDPYGLYSPRDLVLIEPDDKSEIFGIADTLEEITSQVPYVLKGENANFPVEQETTFGNSVILRGREKDLNENYAKLSQSIKNNHDVKFHIQALLPDHEIWNIIQPKSGDGHPSLIFDEGQKLAEKLQSEDLKSLDNFLRKTLRELSLKQIAIYGVRFLSLHSGIAPICYDLGQMFHYSAFNFYCPICNSEVQEDLLQRDYGYSSQKGSDNSPIYYSSNTRCVYDLDEESWFCPTCENKIDNPIPVHKTLDEVLLPAYDRLMEENKNERLRIYSEIRDLEMGYTNNMETEIEQAFQKNRDVVEELLDEKRRFEVEVMGEEEAVRSFENIMQSYSLKQSQAIAQITEKTSGVVAKINQDRKSVIADIDNFYERERNEMVQLMQAFSRAKRIEDEIRDTIFRDIAESSRQTADNTDQIKVDMNRTANATERTADNTDQIKVDMNRTANNTDQIKESTARTADNTDQIKVDMNRTANNTDQISDNTARTADNTDQIKGHTERISKSSEESVKLQKRGNAIQAAMAKRQGVKIRPPWYNLPGRFNHGLKNIENKIMDRDAVDSAAHLEGGK